MPPAQPVTRRELRLAAAQPVTRRELRLAERSARRRRWAPPAGQIPALGLLVSIAFVLGGVTSVQIANDARADRAQVAAESAEQARLERTLDASEARLTGLVTAQAAQHRTEALAAAADALASADATLADADVGAGVAQETKDALLAATARLEALVDEAPAPEVVLGTETAVVADPPAVADDDLTQLQAPVGDNASTPADGVAGADPAQATVAADGPELSRPDYAPEPGDLGPLTAGEAFEALDGETSDEVLAAAQEVTALVAQVRLAAEQAAAERAAAAVAAEAARVAAEQAAAADVAHKIAAADAAPNGAIPSGVLCGVSFDSKVRLRCDAAEDLERLNGAFRDHFGYDISVSDSYRDYDGQVVARETKGDLAAAPGTSNHGRGLAIDLNGFGEYGQFDRPYYVWMSAHAGDYGWLHPSYMNPGGSGPSEPWHWEYKTQ